MLTFQLTRSRGAWLNGNYVYGRTWDFNSHAHVERDLIWVCRTPALKISTHTLTWSVTTECNNWKNEWQFQLTRSRGAWPDPESRPCSYGYFNSHAHVERDLYSGFATGTNYHFNSHAHVERDILTAFMVKVQKISTHTLTWSVTAKSGSISIKTAISTHTLTWSVTLSAVIQGLSWQFQLTRSRGAWRQAFHSELFALHFNSHAHVERDPKLY